LKRFSDIFTSVCLYVCMYALARRYVYVCVFVRVCVREYKYIYMYVCVYVGIYIYTKSTSKSFSIVMVVTSGELDSCGVFQSHCFLLLLLRLIFNKHPQIKKKNSGFIHHALYLAFLTVTLKVHWIARAI